MALLPDVATMGARPIPESRRRVSSVRNAGTVGAAVSGVGDTVTKVGERLGEIQDDAEARRLDMAHAEELRAIVEKAREAKGGDAQPAREAAEREILSLQERTLKAAPNNRVRSALEGVIPQRARAERGNIVQHETRETGVFIEGGIVARRDQNRELAAENYNNPLAAEQYLSIALAEDANLGKWKGAGADQVAAAQFATRTAVRSAIAERMATEGDFEGALAYVDSHSTEIDADAEQRLRAAIRAPLLRIGAQTFVDNMKTLGGTGLGAVPDEPAEPSSAPPKKIATSIAWTSPVPRGGTPTDGFSAPRPGRLHGADDIAGGAGTPFYAAAEGTVSRTYFDKASGWVVEVKHPGGWRSSYAHAKEGSIKVKAGDRVGPGVQLAAIGNTGAASRGNHVHTSIFDPAGKRVDPRRLYGTHSRAAEGAASVPTGKRVDYAAGLAEIKAADLPADMEQAVREAFERRIGMEDRIIDRREEDATRAALDRVEELGDGFTDVTQIPPSLLRDVPPSVRISLGERAERNRRPAETPANGQAVLELQLMATYEPERFKATDLRLYGHQMTKAEFATLARDQAKMRTEPPEASPTANLRSEIDSTIRFYARDVGLNVDSKSTAREREQYLKVFNGMQRTVQSLTEGKRAPTDVELKAAFDRVTMQVETDKGVKGRWFEVDAPGTRMRVDVPLLIQTRIINAYRATRGRIPTEGELMREYVQNKGRAGYWE